MLSKLQRYLQLGDDSIKLICRVEGFAMRLCTCLQMHNASLAQTSSIKEEELLEEEKSEGHSSTS